MKQSISGHLIALCLVGGQAFAQTPDLTSDIEGISERIRDAEATIAQYDGGVIKAMAEYRLETLKLNRALLENRQLASDAGVEPELVLPMVAPDPELAAEILIEIQKQAEAIKAAEAEAQDTGGLVQALALANVETEKVKLSQLELAWYQAQYGIAVPRLVGVNADRVADKDSSPEDPVDTALPDWADPDYPEIDYTGKHFAEYAAAGFEMAGWFAIKETRAEIDDSPKVIASNLSQYHIGGFGENPTLVLQCIEGQPALVYLTDTYMPYDYDSKEMRVTYRIDDQEPVTTSWSVLVNSKGTGAFNGSGIEMMAKVEDSQKLFLRAFDSNGKKYDASFDMRGVDEAVDKVAKACNFSTLILTKDQFATIQKILNTAGFDAGTPDGVWGDGSKVAMRAFQASEGLEETGIPDRPTLEALGIQP